jgi:hypothetical protein
MDASSEKKVRRLTAAHIRPVIKALISQGQQIRK